MQRRMSQIAAIVGAVALVATVGLTVVAMGGGSGEGGDLLGHLHRLGQQLHGGDRHHDAMAELIEQLDLTPDQHQRLERIHTVIGTYGNGESGMAELHEQLVAQFEQGHVETDGIRRLIDGHVEQIRDMAYTVTDELIALVNELDPVQREIMLEHIQGAREGHRGH